MSDVLTARFHKARVLLPVIHLPYVEAYLVATGIEEQFGVLDPVRTNDLAEQIHG